MSAGDAPPRMAVASAENPWPGLLPFGELDAHYFQGRDAETQELYRLVSRERLTVLFGVSGLGKSSLLRAGLFPLVRRDQMLPVDIRLDFSSARPDLVAQVRAALEREGKAHGIEVPRAGLDETLWEYFHRTGNTWWSARNRPVLPLLAFDQFEEIFTLGRLDAARREASADLIAQLADLVEGRPPAAVKARLDANPKEVAAFSFGRHHYKVLFAIREDFLPELEALRKQMPAVALNRLRLRPMTGAAALLVVNQAPHLIDADVAERVVRFVAADREGLPLDDLAVEPALLSVVCRELNLKRGVAPKITASLLDGSQEQVLADFYERSLKDLPAEVRRFIEDRLLTVSGFRDSVAVDNALKEPGMSAQVVALLEDRRLLRRENRGSVQRLELTHDRLTGVVRASRDSRHQKEQEARQQQALLAANEELRRRRRQLRQTQIAGGLFLVLMVLAGAAAYFAVEAQNQARAALDQTLARLRLQLGSLNGELAASALDELTRQHGTAGTLDMIPPELFTSTQWFANVASALEQLAARDVPRAAWVRDVRHQLFARLSAGMHMPPPPSADADGRINRRVPIAGGTFMMGAPVDDMRPPHRVTVSAFQVHEHEVTNAEYRRFDPRHDTEAADDEPVVRVSWHDAFVYATWLSGSLPTEAQWEFAARGPEGRIYPWGREPAPACDRANFFACGSRLASVIVGREQGKTVDGVYDLAGNVWEWCLDWYGVPYPADEQTDPLGPLGGTARVSRGGSYENQAQHMLSVYRGGYSPEFRVHNIGFRVVWPAATDAPVR